MRPYEAEVFAEFKKYANVVESWAHYDSVVISPTFYGSESNVGGWFTSFALFGQQETHSFFKTRTEGIAGAQYCNQQSSDSMDFALLIDSIGLAFLAPACNAETEYGPGDGTPGDAVACDDLVSHWFAAELPDHCAIQLKVQQDIRAEIQAMSCPPGYGATGGGGAYSSQYAPGFADNLPWLTVPVTQGVPVLANRFPLPEPIGVPRTASIEGILHVSETMRTTLQNIRGPASYAFNTDTGLPPYIFFPRRYIIQLSLFGQRLVQQRAQYHR